MLIAILGIVNAAYKLLWNLHITKESCIVTNILHECGAITRGKV